MLQNWLKPLPPSLLKTAAQCSPDQVGNNIIVHADASPLLKGVRVALVGAGDKDANAVREQLYRTTASFPKGQVADLGNLRRAESGVLIPVLYELLSGGIVPIVVGARDALAHAQFLAYQETKSLVNLVVVDEKLRADAQNAELPYSALLYPRHPQLFHFGLVGYQMHITPQAALDFLNRQDFENLRLGRSRAALDETEPVIRDADLLAFHLAALKHLEAPAAAHATPSGFFIEEACQLCRYAGMSDKLTSFGLYGDLRGREYDEPTAQAVSLLVWYFLDGFFSRKNDYPVSKEGLTEYIVEFRRLNYQLTFWKSVKSGRWWMQVPAATKRKHERHRLVPCSYQDYQAACREELPDRLLQALRRFG